MQSCQSLKTNVMTNLAPTFVVEVKLLIELEGAVVGLPVFLEEIIDPLQSEPAAHLFAVIAAFVPVAAVLESAHTGVTGCITLCCVDE